MVMKKGFWIILCMFFIPLVTFAGNMKLHYDRPAEYFEEALVIGNGTMGATLYGGVKKDKISFNDNKEKIASLADARPPITASMKYLVYHRESPHRPIRGMSVHNLYSAPIR